MTADLIIETQLKRWRGRCKLIKSKWAEGVDLSDILLQKVLVLYDYQAGATIILMTDQKIIKFPIESAVRFSDVSIFCTRFA
jgi:hypothetical protein